MTVLRRLDAVLEPTKQAVLDSKAALDSIGVVDQKTAFRRASGEAFYNTSGVQPEGSPGQGQPASGTADFEDTVVPGCGRPLTSRVSIRYRRGWGMDRSRALAARGLRQRRSNIKRRCPPSPVFGNEVVRRWSAPPSG